MRPGVTKHPVASMRSVAAGIGSVEVPTSEMRPFVMATHPPGNSRRAVSTVATRRAL